MQDQDIFSLIDEFQNNIFNGNFTAIPDMFASLSISLKSIHKILPVQYEPNLRQILLILVEAFKNLDYLLLADILEFELKPLLTTSLNGDRQDGCI